jgi:hypothetical protein
MHDSRCESPRRHFFVRFLRILVFVTYETRQRKRMDKPIDDTKDFETSQTSQDVSTNLLQLPWKVPPAVGTVDILMNGLKAGSPTFLMKEDGEQEGFALWISPTLYMVRPLRPGLLKRIEVRSRTPCNTYFTINLSSWIPNGSTCYRKFHDLQAISNFQFNWMDEEVVIGAPSMTDALCLTALLEDFAHNRIASAQDLTKLWSDMRKDLQYQQDNLTDLSCRYPRKVQDPDKLMKFLPLTYHFFSRLSR